MTGFRVDLGQPQDDTVFVYKSGGKIRSERWHWRRAASNGRILARSSEGYFDRTHAINMALRCNPDKTIASIEVEGGL